MEPKQGSMRQTTEAPVLLHFLCFSYFVGRNTTKCVCVYVCACTHAEDFVKVCKYMSAHSYSLQQMNIIHFVLHISTQLWLPDQNILCVCIAWKMTEKRQLESLASHVVLLTISM